MQSTFFTHFNQVLQRDELTIHILRASIERLAKRLANSVVKSEALKSMKSIIDLDLNDENIFIDPENTYLGLQTNSKLKTNFFK